MAPFDQQHAILGIDLVNLQVLRGDAVVAHPARHARALKTRPGVEHPPIEPGGGEPPLRTVRGAGHGKP